MMVLLLFVDSSIFILFPMVYLIIVLPFRRGIELAMAKSLSFELFSSRMGWDNISILHVLFFSLE